MGNLTTESKKLKVKSQNYKAKFKTFKFLIVFLSFSFLLLSYLYSFFPCYAQEQDIAESFGLYSKGIDYYHEGKLYEAQEILEQAVRLDSRNDEAQGYLDLVNAEINMREQGRLNSYQDAGDLKRESDFTADTGFDSAKTGQIPLSSKQDSRQDEPDAQFLD